MTTPVTTPDAAREFIDQPEAFIAFCNDIAASEWIALDTEFIREETYWPQLCLVQVATPERVACIDPLALKNLDPLLALLYDENIVKVLHAANQDLEIFHHMTGKIPAPLFDTQIAAPLLGHREQAGFANLTADVLDVQLPKDHARTDWTERPLPAAALDYAANDVRYLVPLYLQIRQALDERGRLEWLQPEFQQLENPARFERPAADAWQRIRGIERLRPASIAVAQAIAEWRENLARDTDVPRGRILRDDALLDIARSLPTSQRDLARNRSLRKPTQDRYGDELLALVAAARDRTPPATTPRKTRGPVSTDTEALADLLQMVVRLVAQDHDLAPGTLASRKELLRIAAGESAAEVLPGWRSHVVAETLTNIVTGRAGVVVQDGRPEIIPAERN